MKVYYKNGKVYVQSDGDILTPEKPVSPEQSIQIQIDSKVPQALSIFPQVRNEQIGASAERIKGKIYIDINDTPSYLTLQQIKELGTKTICVDALTDSRVVALDDGDFVLLKKE